MELPQFNYGHKNQHQHIVEREVVTEIRHPTLQDNMSALHFDFALAENEFMVMSETYLYVKCQAQIKNSAEATSLEDFAKVAPLNYMLNSMIKQATIEINGTSVTPSTNTFAYKAYLESLLMYNKDARTSHLTAAGIIGPFQQRSAMLNGGDEFELMGRIHFDLTHQPRPIPGGCSVSIKLDLNSPQFVFQSSDSAVKPKLKICEALLSVRRAVVSPLALRRIYAQKHLAIPYEKSYVRNFPIRKGALEEPLEDICRGRLPRRLFFCMVSSQAYHGDYAKDALEFKHFNLNSFACFVDGVQYPTQAYRPNMSANHCIKEYVGLVQTLNQNNTDSYAGISYDEFRNNKFILGVNLAPDCFDYDGYNGVTNPPREGTLRIQLGFATETTEAIQGLIYLEFDSEIGVGPTGIIADISSVDTR